MIEKAENQQTLADFLLLAQNVEKELASAVQSIDMVQDEKKPLLKTYLKSEPLGAKYLVFVSSRSVKMRELSFAQFVYFLRKVCLFFNFLNNKMHNYVLFHIFVYFFLFKN